MNLKHIRPNDDIDVGNEVEDESRFEIQIVNVKLQVKQGTQISNAIDLESSRDVITLNDLDEGIE